MKLLKDARLRLWSNKGTVGECEDSWMSFCGAMEWNGKWIGVRSLEDFDEGFVRENAVHSTSNDGALYTDSSRIEEGN